MTIGIASTSAGCGPRRRGAPRPTPGSPGSAGRSRRLEGSSHDAGRDAAASKACAAGTGKVARAGCGCRARSIRRYDPGECRRGRNPAALLLWKVPETSYSGDRLERYQTLTSVAAVRAAARGSSCGSRSGAGPSTAGAGRLAPCVSSAGGEEAPVEEPDPLLLAVDPDIFGHLFKRRRRPHRQDLTGRMHLVIADGLAHRLPSGRLGRNRPARQHGAAPRGMP
jgi:hypothetical protein